MALRTHVMAPTRQRWIRHLALPGTLLVLLLATAASAVQLQLDAVDSSGVATPVRWSIKDGQGHWVPAGADSINLSHYDSYMGMYFYGNGPVSLQVGTGTATIIACKGLECRPITLKPNITTDTSFVVTMTPVFDMRSRNWYGGDTHEHTAHPPVDYPNINRARAFEIQQAEDLAMMWCLDNGGYFIGGPDPLSTAQSILYYATEWRNQAYGHAALLGLKITDNVGYGCCTPPSAAWPLLSEVRQSWNPGWDQAMALAHPCTGAGFWDDNGWPAWGLGREAPVLASSGNLDLYDIASYSDTDDVALPDWYNLLNLGLHVSPSAGDDAMLDRYFCRPGGGYRVYVEEDQGHSASTWVQNLKAGRSFITNFPLIPIFTVDGANAGDTMDRPGPTATVTVHARVESVLGVSTAQVIVNGQVAASYKLQSGPTGTVWESTFPITLTEGSWIALKVTGTTTSRAAPSPNLFAHTGPVYVTMNGSPVVRTAAAGYFADWVDSLQVFANRRGGWPSRSDSLDIVTHLNASRAFYDAYFHVPPGPFALEAPANLDTVNDAGPVLFDWDDAVDPEQGDRVTYTVSICADTTFLGGLNSPILYASNWNVPHLYLATNKLYWWKVTAKDRAGNHTPSTPRYQQFYLTSDPASVRTQQSPLAGGSNRPRLLLWPNPSSSTVSIQLAGTPIGACQFWVCDVGGRQIAVLPALGPPGSPIGAIWNGTDSRGRAVPSGVYLVKAVPTSSAGEAPAMRTRVLILR